MQEELGELRVGLFEGECGLCGGGGLALGLGLRGALLRRGLLGPGGGLESWLWERGGLGLFLVLGGVRGIGGGGGTCEWS